MEENLRRKAVLILGGAVSLPEGYRLPVRMSQSTAGPGAGYSSAVFAFGDYRVKKTVTYDGTGEFQLVVDENHRLSMTRKGKPFLNRVRIEPVIRHCPQQAFFNLDPGCMFNCAFCTSPLLDPSECKQLTTERIMKMLDDSIFVFEDEVKAVSFTSGVVGSVEETMNRFVEVISAVREKYPDMPIGVEPYVSSREDIQRLKDAGADEIKINLESARRDVFVKACPDLDYDRILDLLQDAVDIFGRGNVVTNILYGMGETIADLDIIMERLCKMGVIPCLRALRVNERNKQRLIDAKIRWQPVKPQYAYDVALLQKAAMKRHGLTAENSRTMCLACKCCDLVPFVDL